MTKPLKTLQVGAFYNWVNQPERLVYIGRSRGTGANWHQFEKRDAPGVVWCEILNSDIHLLEATLPSTEDVCHTVNIAVSVVYKITGACNEVTAEQLRSTWYDAVVGSGVESNSNIVMTECNVTKTVV